MSRIVVNPPTFLVLIFQRVPQETRHGGVVREAARRSRKIIRVARQRFPRGGSSHPAPVVVGQPGHPRGTAAFLFTDRPVAETQRFLWGQRSVKFFKVSPRRSNFVPVSTRFGSSITLHPNSTELEVASVMWDSKLERSRFRSRWRDADPFLSEVNETFVTFDWYLAISTISIQSGIKMGGQLSILRKARLNEFF